MLGIKNLNDSTYTSSDYTRLSDGIPPQYYNSNSNSNQGQPYNPLYNGQNKGSNNKPFINQNENFNNPANQAHQTRCASMIRCLALTVIIQNMLYIVFDIIYNGLKLNIGYFLMISEGILFGYYLSQIKNGMVPHEKFTQVRKAFMATCILYTLYFIVTGVIVIASINDTHPDIDTLASVITIMIISSFIFLVPRFIGLFLAISVKSRNQILIAHR